MPNKTKIAFILVAVVAVFSVYKLSLFLHNIANESVGGTQALISQDDQNCDTCDPDHDGLTNAQEVAWGSDPLNADTDGDGFKDGEEVASGHNPLVPGPNDLLNDDNLSDQFAQLAASGIYAGALNPASDSYAGALSDIADSVTDSAKYVFNKTVDPSSLTTINDNTQNDLGYLSHSMPLLKQFGILLGQQFNSLSDNLNMINQNGFSNAKSQSFFTSQSSAYDTLDQTLSGMVVPNGFRNSHAYFQTLVEQMKIISDAIANGDKDSLKASMAFNSLGNMYQNYLTLVSDYNTSVEDLKLDPKAVANAIK